MSHAVMSYEVGDGPRREAERTDRQRDYTCSLPVFPEQEWELYLI